MAITRCLCSKECLDIKKYWLLFHDNLPLGHLSSVRNVRCLQKCCPFAFFPNKLINFFCSKSFIVCILWYLVISRQYTISDPSHDDNLCIAPSCQHCRQLLYQLSHRVNPKKNWFQAQVVIMARIKKYKNTIQKWLKTTT